MGILATFSTEGSKQIVSLHGGPNALDTVLFEQIKPEASVLFGPAELAALKATEYSSTIFTATMPDGHNGYPGAVRVETLIALVDPAQVPEISAPQHVDLGSILIVYRARLAEPNQITPINLTQVSIFSNTSYFVRLMLGGLIALGIQSRSFTSPYTQSQRTRSLLDSQIGSASSGRCGFPTNRGTSIHLWNSTRTQRQAYRRPIPGRGLWQVSMLFCTLYSRLTLLLTFGHSQTTFTYSRWRHTKRPSQVNLPVLSLRHYPV